MKNLFLLVALFIMASAQSQIKAPVGKADFSDWAGILKTKNNTATVESGQTISYRYSNCNRRPLGLQRDLYGDAADWSDYSGITFDVFLKSKSLAKIQLSLLVDTLDVEELNPVSTAGLQIIGEGWQKVYIPWEMLDLPVGSKGATLQYIKDVQLTVNSEKNKTVQIRNINITKGKEIALTSAIQGKSAPAGGAVTYELEVGNTSDDAQGVNLKLEQHGWESMEVSITPSVFELEPGEIKNCTVSVTIPASLPQGIRESQVLKVSGNGATVETIEFITAVQVASPNILFTEDKWQEVKDKVENYDWAKKELKKYEAKAQKWEIPKSRVSFNKDGSYKNRQIVHKNVSGDLKGCAVAYQLTGKNEYVEKCMDFFRMLTDPETGYPATLIASGEGFVHEGVVFQSFAKAYDMIRNSDLITEKEHELIQNTLRIYSERTVKNSQRGGISNWDVAEITGALYSALALQDWHLVNTLLYGPTGIYNQIAHGIMSDGWWYECAVGYNLWVASEFSEISIALKPWGINLTDEDIAIGTTPHFSLMASRRVGGQHGMEFMKWGTIQKNNIGIKDMWDAVVPFLDYRGVLPAVNDAKESEVTGTPYELAYYLYGDPEYAAIINKGNERDLLYGVPELPQVESSKNKQSAYADNIGLVQLRSQTKDREQKDQIQAALHYGSHGGHHGHFDRTNFISMMRYGRSFYNPEMYWYGYSPYLYKFLVQTSINKNMVVVDQKMQEPRESFKTFYYTGDMVQATAVETNARWSHPPYGGMIYPSQNNKDFAHKMWKDSRTFEIPENAPEYGLCTDYTEDILQRRLMLMLDDYVILADYMQAEEEHTFDWLMQIKGFTGITGDKKEFLRHDNQMNPDPLGSAQFTTDCDWYNIEGTSRASFEMCWGEGCDNAGARMPHSEDGDLKIDVFTAWPKQNEVMIGTAPENFSVNKKLWYTVKADDAELLNDSTGAWVLGSQNIDVNIKGKKQLVLTTKTDGARNNTIFWGNAKLVLKDGSELFVADLPAKYNNIIQPKAKGLDYYDGPVKIAGELMEHSTPGMPKNIKEQGEVVLDLSGIEAVSFKAKLGGDFPLGDETSRRKTMAVRSQGKTARYLSVIEPFESTSAIKSVVAKSDSELTVELLDGRVQEITISGLESENSNIKVSVKEFKNGKLLREEHSN